MAHRMLLVGENISSFILNAIREGLKEKGYEVYTAQPKVNELCSISPAPDHVLIYAGDYIDSSTNALIFLRDYCIEHEKRASMVGYQEEVTALKKIFPPECVGYIFERPLNVKELVSRLEEDAQKKDEDAFKKHILVVDDSGTMLRTIKAWLSMKYKVSIASSAAMAITFLASNKPDLILLDYEMPVCDGPQFLGMIRSEIPTRDIPVMFLTAKGDRESVKRVLEYKPAGYLLKTMKPEDILQTLDDFFEKQKRV